MIDEIVCEISVCEDCMHARESGEIGPDRPADLPEPWSQIQSDESVTMGGTHSDGCDGSGECDCDSLGFCQTSCDACGDWHHGDRFRYTLWRATRS